MGFWDRAWDVATGLGGALQAPLGLVKDLATAPFTDDEYDGILGTLVGSVENRFGQLVSNVFGPDEGFGALIGGLPQGLRSQRLGGAIASGAGAGALGGSVGGPLGAAVGGVAGGIYGAVRGFEGVSGDVETLYREGFSRPISTAVTAASLGQAGEGGLFSADSWRRAYRISEDRSWGQAIALAVLTEDVTDTAEVNRALGTDLFRAISGTVDAFGRLAADPSVVAGRVAGGVRQANYIRPLKDADAVKAAAFDARVETALGEMEGMSAAQIRERYFRDHSHGSVIAASLADAEDVATRQQVFRSLVGDDDALSALYEQRADLAGQIDRIVGQQAAANNLTRAGFELPAEMKRDIKVRTDAELEALYGQKEQLDRIAAAAGTVRDLKFASWQAKPGQMLRDDLPRSTFFQDSPAAAPLRLARNLGGFRPGPLVNFHDASGDVTLNRMLRNAGVDANVADDLRSRYVQQLDPSARQSVFDEAVEKVVEHYANRAGMSAGELERFMAETRRRRGEQYAEVSRSRSYDAKGRGVMEWLDDDGVTHRHALPIWLTQEANFGVVPNLDLLEQAASKAGRWRARHPNSDIPVQLMETFHRVWKPSVLFRVGWPIRVVGEEQLRIAAKIGAMTHAGNLLRNAKEWSVDAIDHARRLGVDPDSGRQVPWAEAKNRFGLGWHEVNGHKVQKAFGTPEDGVNVHKALVAQTANLQKKLYGIEDELLKEAREHAAGWRTMQPTDADYGRFWAHNLNKQVAQDAVGRRLLQGRSVDEVVRWLREDPAGQAYFDRSPLYRGAQSRGHTLEEVVGWQQGVIDDLTQGDAGIREKALKGTANIEDLRRVQPDEGLWEPINGGVVQEAYGGSQAGKFIKKQVERVYRTLGGYPTTILSRNPYFKHVYDAEVERLLNVRGRSADNVLDDVQLRDIETKAREYALDETRKTLFDLSEESNLAHMLRFISPFFMAQQEVLTRWVGLTAQNPAFVAKMRLVWQSPEKAGLIVDENGNTINENGEATQPLTGEKVEPGESRYLTFPVPEWAMESDQTKLPQFLVELGARFLPENARINKESLNVALQLNSGIGTGPLVQVPVNELVKDRPELQDAVKWALPYGSTQDTLGLIMPATLKRIRTQADQDGDQFKNSVMRIYFDEVVNYNLGERDTKPTFAEAQKKAREFWSMRTVANAVMPAAPWFVSPYQLHIDAYRNAQDRYREDPDSLGGQTPDEWFLERFGEEFFALTQSISQSVDGVPPTIEGHAARKKHADLIHNLRTPSLGSLVIGEEGAGEFNRSVYEHQKLAPVRPGSDTKQREALSFEEAQAAPEVRMGWMKFSRFMDLLDAEMVSMGLPNLQVKEAQGLANLKRAYIAKLAEQHPEWYREFADPDPLKAQDRLNDLRTIASDPGLSKRHDIQGLQQYLKIRDTFTAELERRKALGGPSTLGAQANQDLAFLWETMVSKLVQENLPFGDLYHRWLSNDAPQIVAVEVAA